MRVSIIKWNPGVPYGYKFAVMVHLIAQGAVVMPAPWKGYRTPWEVFWDV